MSANPTRNSNVTGRSRSPSPGTHPPHNSHPQTTRANNNLLNPENSNLYRSRRSSNSKSSDSIPLIDIDKPLQPPLANPEIDDTQDDREVVNAPYPGVDDGFFNNDDETETSIVLSDRAGDMPEGEGADNPDAPMGVPKGRPMSPNNGRDFRPFPDVEFGLVPSDLESIPDINLYQHKKTLAQGMMDLALFSANANQLRYVLESDRHPYFYPGVILIAFSLILQVAIGVGLIWNSRYNVKDAKEICIANKINNFTVIGIFLVTVVNVFISAFGVASVQPVAAAAP